MGQMVRPIERVALYVPGGTASYPSTVLMNALPAKLAGVKDLVIITPVKADGKVNPIIIAAAKVCGIETIYKFGGAQGVVAVAQGTKTIKKVDKIVGPGNIFVATAKKLSYGLVDIDMVAGPSEVLVIADENANSKYIAADLMSQAEHDKLASALLVTTSKDLVEKVNQELKRQIETLSRKEIIEESLKNYGGAIIVKDIDKAFEVSNYLAPEHLEVLVDNPVNTLPKIKNAGSIFLGEYSPEPLGDYMSGTNHVLPTGGTAKFYSALGVYDFVKYSSYSYYPKNVLSEFKDHVIKFVNSEGYKMYLIKHMEKISSLYQMSDSILKLRQNDTKYADDLVKAYGIDLTVEVSDEIKIGGFIIENKATNVVVDESLDTALENQKEWFYKTSGLMIK